MAQKERGPGAAAPISSRSREHPGRFNDGRTAASREVIVRAEPAGLEIRDPGGLMVAFWNTADLRADGDLPGGRGVRLRCSAEPDARLSVEDAVFARGHLPSFRRRPPLSRLAVPLALAGAVLAGTAMVSGLPVLSQAVVALVPPAMEREWGRHIASGLSAHARLCRRPAGEAALSGLVSRLSAGLPEGLREVRLLVLDDRTVNAMALPGGVVVVFRGLIDQADGPDELAGVLAHELAHLGERHPTAGLVRGLGIGVLMTLVTGDASGLLASGAAVAMVASYSRADEATADRGAVALLAGAGLGPEGLAAFFRRIAARERDTLPEWLSTHPNPEARAAAVEARTRRPRPPALRDDEWLAVKRICG